ncbi:MAG: AsmA family protein, partial [Bacteroidia bacterium]|nr:AsmA family protein [Bacteroidia bacterium]
MIPIFFEEDIHNAIKKEINAKIKAKVDYSGFSLSLIRDFPNASLRLSNLTVIGLEEFHSDTLANLGNLQVSANLLSVISGQKIEIKKILLEDGKILAKVLKNGKANWDISIPDSTAQDTTPTKFALQLKKYKLTNCSIIYDDRSLPAYVKMTGLNHTGSGDFTQDVFELETQTEIQQLLATYENTTYLNKVRLEADVNLNIDNRSSEYTFQKNRFQINDLELTIDGKTALKDKDIVTDVRFKTTKTDFKSLISLIPAVYKENFKDLKTSGSFALDGFVKGTYNETNLPGYGLKLIVENGFFQYPNLPMAVKDVNLDLNVQNPSGITEQIHVLLKKFHAKIGNNPIDASASVSGISNMNIDAWVKGTLNIEEFSKIFPMQNLTAKGNFQIDASAKGIYNKTSLPSIKAAMDMKFGYLKSADFPAALENLTFSATVENPTGKLEDTKINVERFHTEIDKEPIDANLIVENLDNPAFDINLKGNLDLEKLTKIYPIEGMTLAGKILADIQTKGKKSDIDA